MDEARHYREQAEELRKIADGTSDEIMRRRLLKNVTSCEQMAFALDTIATAVCAQAKLNVRHASDKTVITKRNDSDFWGRRL
jgi:hypothetical protein